MLTLRCFGQVAVIDEVGNERTLRSRKHLGLLVYLLAHPRTTHPREDLADLLWGDSGARARHSLSQALYDIRSNMGDLVEVTSTSVRSCPGRMVYEAERFEDAVERGDHDTALELYQGDFAPDLTGLGIETFDRWVDAERERCRVLASLALRNAQRAAEERGDWDRMCLASLRLVRMNEFDEEAHCALMRGLWMKGDPASALRHYRSLDEDLAQGWTSARDLAERLGRSGSVREVLALPRAPVDLVGREESFQQLLRLAREYRRTGAVVAVTGEAGVGKSALIREFARLAGVQGAAIEREGQPHKAVGSGDRTDEGAARLTIGLYSTGAGAAEWPDIDRRPRHLMLVETRDSAAARTALNRRDCDSVVALSRLTEQETLQVVERECRGGPSALAAKLAHLSGGNPRLALEMVRVLVSRGLIAELVNAPSHVVGSLLLSDSMTLRHQIRAWLEDLSVDAQSLATRLAILSPETCLSMSQQGMDAREKTALSQLETLGWISRKDHGLSLAHPIVELAIQGSTPAATCDQIREEVASVLSQGPPGARYLAARELSIAGQCRRAFEESMRSASDAGEEGDLELASKAGELALSRASTVKDRFDSAILLARSELSRGRPVAAEAVVRRVQHFATTDSARLEAQLLLVRSLTAAEDRESAVTEADIACDLAGRIGDRRLTSITKLASAEARLTAAIGTMTGPALNEVADGLERELQATREVAEVWPEPWQASFRTLFLFRMISTSRTSAEMLLTRFAHVLYRTNDRQGRHVADLGRAVVEIRAGRLRTARPMVEALVTAAPGSDRSRAVTLNNLGVVLTELGEFSSARRIFTEVGTLDHALQPAEAEQISTLLNHAQTAWFMSDHAAVHDLAGEALNRASVHDEPHLEAEAIALLGLSASEVGRAKTVHLMTDRLSAIEPWTSRIQDRYLVTWFRAVANRGAGGDPSEELWEAARTADDTDRLAAAKLAVIASCFGCRGEEQERDRARALRDLRRNGVGWFVRRAAV